MGAVAAAVPPLFVVWKSHPAIKLGAPEGVMLITRDLDPVPPAFVALTVAVVVPAVVGDPEISPVPVSTLRPAGRLLAP